MMLSSWKKAYALGCLLACGLFGCAEARPAAASSVPTQHQSLASREGTSVGIKSAGLEGGGASDGRSCQSGPRRGPLTFSEEFDSALQLPGPKFLTWYKRWGNLRTLVGNKEQQVYLDPEQASELEATAPLTFGNGVLRITADHAPAKAKRDHNADYTSGLITTEESFVQQYGVFEMRAKLPRGRGLWPAFWMVAETHDANYEIDIMEVLGHEPARVYHSLHGPDQTYLVQKESRGVDTAEGFHTYAVEWSPEAICFYVDGIFTEQAPNRFSIPMYMIANLAVGGSWPGAPDAQTGFPATMEVDYIRAYQLAEEAL